MADDSSSPLGLPPSVWIAAVLSLAGLFALSQRPFLDTRPTDAGKSPYRHVPSEDQDVEARLWEDPLGAVANALAAGEHAPADSSAAGANDPSATRSRARGAGAASRMVDAGCPHACPSATASASAPSDHGLGRLARSFATNSAGANGVLVLGAIVPGAPYADAIEARRRIRYSVLAGLQGADYVPVNSDHVGYVSLAALYADPTHGHDIAVYEWLKPDRPRGTATHRVLLVWLDQDGFRDKPLWLFQRIVDSIEPAKQASQSAAGKRVAVATGGDVPRITAALLGPADSDGLLAMREELESCPDDKPCIPDRSIRRPIAIYSSRATAADEWVLSGGGSCRATDLSPPAAPTPSLADKFQQWSGNITLVRTVADDCTVTRSVYRELRYRGVEDASQIALIAERDTLYARRMGDYFGMCALSPVVSWPADPPNAGSSAHPTAKRGEDTHPLCFTYLRGLDGLAPPAPDATDSTSKPSGAAAYSASPSAAPSAAPSEAANGPGQLDYLRRLSTALSAHVARSGCRAHASKTSTVTTCPGHGIRAIGVLGSDVYDKLMVLQALRGAFPHVTFFTTDLDARLLEQKSLNWTRHLVVGSSLGLALRPELQGSIPPFRDVYQSATYFSTLLAMDRFFRCEAVAQRRTATPAGTAQPKPLAECPDPDTAKSALPAKPSPAKRPSAALDWLATPRVFEIGHTEAFDLHNDSLARNPCELGATCGSLSAARTSPVWNGRPWWFGPLLGGALAIGALALGWASLGTRWLLRTLNAIRRPWRAGRISWRRAGVLTTVGAIVLIPAIAWPVLADLITNGNERVPTPVFGGASLWAAGLTETLSILVVIVLMIRGQRMLNENVEDIRRDFHLAGSARDLIKWRAEHLEGKDRYYQAVAWLPGNTLSADAAELAGDKDVAPLEALMAHYLYRGQGYARAVRVAIATVLSTAVLVFLEYWLEKSLVGGADLLDEGVSAKGLVAAISLVNLLAMQALIFWSADAMLLSRAFFLDLLSFNPAWPEGTLKSECVRLDLLPEWTTTWLDLRLIGARTECVASLVFYPSIVIAAMTVAAFTVEYGELGFSSNPVALLVSTVFVIIAAVMLRGTAESWRGSARTRLENARLAELGANGSDSPLASQLKALLKRVDRLRDGAFAPYAQQPLVRAVLVPAVTYAATLGLQYLQGTP